MKQLLLTCAFFAGLANAGSINLTPINDGRGTVGTAANFAVVSGTVTTNSSGFADILLDFNYRPTGNGGPSTPLGAYLLGGVTLDVGDVLFQVGGHDYGIAIASHSGSPNGSNASLFATVQAGHFYESTSLLTADTVLNHPSFGFRPTADVWLGAAVTDLGTLTETITYHAGQTPDYVVELTGQLPASFLADVAANNGLSADFASATCGNGLLVGSGTLGSVPEPASLSLIGGGLLALALLTRRRKNGVA
jgi:hypothetical protein